MDTSNSNENNDSNASGNNSQPQRPPHKKTQSQQDKDDDKARQDAEEKLVQGWMDRLQLISVITTFFAANEAQLLSITTPSDPSTPPGQTSPTAQTANAMLSGALVLHTFSAVVAFIGAFVLVRYKVKEAKEEEAKEEGKTEKDKVNYRENAKKQGQLWSSNPHIEQVGYFMPRCPPGSLMQQTHSVAIITAFVGFVFSIVGMLCYAWSQQARSVSIFSSACVAACLLLSLIIIKPFAKAEERT